VEGEVVEGEVEVGGVGGEGEVEVGGGIDFRATAVAAVANSMRGKDDSGVERLAIVPVGVVDIGLELETGFWRLAIVSVGVVDTGLELETATVAAAIEASKLGLLLENSGKTLVEEEDTIGTLLLLVIF
jgi:hypothetical protein